MPPRDRSPWIGDRQGRNATYSGVTGNMGVPGGDYVPEPGPLLDGAFPVCNCEQELSAGSPDQTAAKRPIPPDGLAGV